MNVPVKLVGFAVALAAVFALAMGVGNAVGPVGSADDSSTHSEGHADSGDGASAAGDEHAAMGAADTQPGGLMISEHGYTLDLGDRIPRAGEEVPVTFQVLGPDRTPVTDYTDTHDKDLHFIAVRRDMTGFQHVHPTRIDAEAWQATLDLTPGSWRFFADFQPTDHGETMTLGVDAAVAGDSTPRPLPEASRTEQVGDYTVTLDGSLAAGESSELTLSVSRDGEPVTDLQPYLAAYGHLVALRAGDLAYLHVHPDGAPGDGTTQPGPDITFYATAPSANDYRLFLDFKHEGVVRTAEFTVRATGAPADATTGEQQAPGSGSDGGENGDDGHSH